ncbi:MAG: PHP domain-containing protein [Oscillospiraceae bacterium]|nr:PHP domain-containing protein [Oscillospiraceae bacterium]
MELIDEKGDFHIHTVYSDGTHTPKEILEYVKSSKLQYFSITDHDNVHAVEEVLKIIKDKNIKFIPGIELSTYNNDESIHVLGYFKDENYKNKDFLNKLEEIRNFRVNRASEIVSKLNFYFDIKIDFNRLKEISKGVIARPHIAQCIIEAGYPYTYESIFKTILNKKSPAYVDTKAISTIDGIKLLKNYNAVVFLAHPKIYKKNKLKDLLALGFDGFEAIYPLNKIEETLEYIKLAKHENMVISAGTDFHSIKKDDTHPASIGEFYLNGNDLTKFLITLIKG